MDRRTLDISIISDVHLGTYACHAKELVRYLRSIQPELLVLNGNFIDLAQFKKGHLPKVHLEVISEVLNLAIAGTRVYYLVGDQEDVMHHFTDLALGKISLRDKLVLQLKNKKYWIFHGNEFYPTKRHVSRWSRWRERAGNWIGIYRNRRNSKLSKQEVRQRMRYAEYQRNRSKQTLKIQDEFEHKAAELAVSEGYDGVICGHIHHPVIKDLSISEKAIRYMNCGDWVENLTALEHNWGKWSLYEYEELDFNYVNPRLHVKDRRGKETERALF